MYIVCVVHIEHACSTSLNFKRYKQSVKVRLSIISCLLPLSVQSPLCIVDEGKEREREKEKEKEEEAHTNFTFRRLVK